MKLPSSSSLLFATLAISSSSSTLAAPAGECDTTMTTSSSNHHLSAFLGSCDINSADIDVEQQKAGTTVETSEVDPEARRMPTLLKLIHTLPIIGHPFASLFEKSFSNGTDSVEGMPDISPDELNALQAAIAEVARTLNQTATGVSSTVLSDSGTAPTATSNVDGPNAISSTSEDFSSTSAALADLSSVAADGSSTTDGATATQISSGSASTPPSSSPTIPGNPPNTPVPLAAHVG